MEDHQQEETTPEGSGKPKTFDEAFESMTGEDISQATSGEEASPKPPPEKKSPLEELADNPRDPNAIPEWVSFPANYKMPPDKEVAFMRFRAKWTDRPSKGDRWCMLWSLSDADEKIAYKRTRGEAGRSLAELSKQCVRLIDGQKADWTGNPKDGAIAVDRFWDEIGGKCRQMIANYYHKTHNLDLAEQADFFLNCLVVRNTGGGG